MKQYFLMKHYIQQNLQVKYQYFLRSQTLKSRWKMLVIRSQGSVYYSNTSSLTLFIPQSSNKLPNLLAGRFTPAANVDVHVRRQSTPSR